VVVGFVIRSAATAAILAGAHAGVAAPGGEIVFTRSLGENGIPSLYVMASDGANVRLVVRDGSDAAVSPCGSRIAFVRRHAIWLTRRDGTGQQGLTKSPTKRGPYAGDADPAWSPAHDLLLAFVAVAEGRVVIPRGGLRDRRGRRAPSPTVPPTSARHG